MVTKIVKSIFHLKDRLFFRLFLSYFVLLTFFLVFSFLVIRYITSQTINTSIQNSSRYIYIALSDILEVYLISRSPAYLDEAKKIAEMYPYLLAFAIYDQNGDMVSSYKKDHYNIPEVTFRDNRYIKVPRFGSVYVSFFPINFSPSTLSDQSVRAFLRLDLSRTYYEEIPRKTSFFIFVGYLAFSVLSILVALFFSVRFVDSISNLLSAIQEIKRGNFDKRISKKSGVREIDELIDAVNNMARALKMFAAELEQSREQFRIIADFTADWEYWEDPAGRLIYVSPACERITGYSPQQFIDDPSLMERIIHPNDREAWLKHKREIHRRRIVGREFEFRIITAEGTTKWIAHLCNPVYNQKGIFLGIRGSNRDITYRKELEQRIFQAQKMESISRLAGGIAHDLNNLMTAIVGQAELLKFSLPKGSKDYERVQKILEIAQRSSDLVEKLLDYARGHKFKPELVNLNQIVQASLRLQETILNGKIDLSLKLQPQLKPIHGDPNQLTQILMNLVINAVEAMKDGGQLSVETKNIRLTSPVEDIPPGEYVVLRVKDTGCGMGRETLEKIFEPFFSTKDFGRGLGLAAVFGIVKTHNGHIKVYSKKGKGTLFEVYFPAHTGTNPQNRTYGSPESRYDA